MSDEKKGLGGLFQSGRKLGEELSKRVQDTAKQIAESEEAQRLARLAEEKTRQAGEAATNASKSFISRADRLKLALAQLDTTEFRGRLDANIARYRSAFQKTAYQGKPAVLVLGRTGAGKSTLINAVLGTDAAPTGSGEPITQDFSLYSAEGLPLDFYDSPGWEGGKEKAENFLQQTRALLRDHEGQIQVIWYVMDAQATRLVDFEIELLQNVLHTRPVCLLLSKCDIATDEQIIGLLRAIIGAKIPSQIGAFEVAAEPLQPLESDLQERFSHQGVLAQSYYVMGMKG